MLPFDQLQITNQCVAICDLRAWSGPSSPAWTLLSGTQDEVGKRLADAIQSLEVSRLDDFGGVAESILCVNDVYRDDPPKVRGGAAVFSFTPKKRLLAEGKEMARVSAAAGYSLLILTLQKHDKYGKVWVLCGALRYLASEPLTYYEDTNAIVDELKGSAEGDKIVAVHVQAPGFESHLAHLADSVMSQSEYQHEILVQPLAPNAA